MVHYRRSRVVGGTFFFTVTLRDRRSDLLVRHVDLLRDAWRAAKDRVAHDVVAVVILPEHLHAVIEMRDDSGDYSRLWQDIKKGFSRRVAASGWRMAGGRSLWQSRFWEHTVRDDADLRAHVDYVHFNPVKHGLTTCVVDWPHSSFHRYVREGWLPRGWAGAGEVGRGRGERQD